LLRAKLREVRVLEAMAEFPSPLEKKKEMKIKERRKGKISSHVSRD